MPNFAPRSPRPAATLVTVVVLALAVTAAPTLAQAPGLTQRYQGPGTISGNIPTLPASIPVTGTIALQIPSSLAKGTGSTGGDVFFLDIGASASGQDVNFSASRIRNVNFSGTGPAFGIDFEAELRAEVVLGTDTIVATTDGFVDFVGTLDPNGQGLIESQGPPVDVLVGGNPVGNLTQIAFAAVPACIDGPLNICLNNGRFRVEVDWRDFTDNVGQATVVPFGSNDSGLLYFFQPDNWEMLIKIIDGCPITNHFWVFAAATTNVEYTIRVTDTQQDEVMQYFNPLGTQAPAITDTAAFATCP